MHTTAPDLVGLPPALLGASAAARQARELLARPGQAPMLLLAEEGLDAAEVARYVHDTTRHGQPFVTVDCARPDADALEAELFGVRARAAAELETLGAAAALLAARRGTLLLDHLGELPAALQHELLRSPTTVRFPGGETYVELRDRVVEALADITARHDRVAVVSHAGAIRAALATYLLMEEAALWRLDQRFGAVNVIELVEGVPLIRLVNG